MVPWCAKLQQKGAQGCSGCFSGVTIVLLWALLVSESSTGYSASIVHSRAEHPQGLTLVRGADTVDDGLHAAAGLQGGHAGLIM